MSSWKHEYIDETKVREDVEALSGPISVEERCYLTGEICVCPELLQCSECDVDKALHKKGVVGKARVRAGIKNSIRSSINRVEKEMTEI